MAKREELTLEQAERQRAAVRSVMDAKGLRASPWALAAGVSSGSLYAFLKGRTNHLGTPLVARLAEAAGVPMAMLTGEGPTPEAFTVTHHLRGDLISPMPQRNGRRMAPIPPDVNPVGLAAAEAATDQQGAFREGATVYWHQGIDRRADEKPGLCVCKLAGQDAMVLADLRRGFGEGRHLLLTVSGRVLDSVELEAAYKVVWIKAPD